MKTFNSLTPRRFGIELEVSRRLTCINYADKQYGPAWTELSEMIRVMHEKRQIGNWKVKVDTSCGGELVSPILTGVAGLKEVALVCDRTKKVAKKFGLPAVDGECGLHVHVDVADFKPHHLANLTTLVYLAEPIIYAMYPNRNHEYCAPIDMNMRLVTNWNTWIDVRDTWYRSSNNVKDKSVVYDDKFINSASGGGGGNHNHYDGTRYHGFNIHCYWRQHTVEFRYAAGTLDPLHVRAYYEMCLAMVNTAWESKKKFAADETLLNMKYLGLRQHYTTANRFRKMLVEVSKKCNWSRATMRLILSLLKKNSPVLIMKDPSKHKIIIDASTKDRYWYHDASRAAYYDGAGQRMNMTPDLVLLKQIIEVSIETHRDGRYFLRPGTRNVTMVHTIYVDPRQQPKNAGLGEIAVGGGAQFAPPVANVTFFDNFAAATTPTVLTATPTNNP